MRTLQAASKALISILLAQLAPSGARISISRPGHQKIPIVIHGYRDFLIIRFGMRSLQVAGKALASTFLAQLAPSEARISISRPGHQKPPIVFHGYRGYLIIRFGMRTLRAASDYLFSAFFAQLAPAPRAGFRSPVLVIVANICRTLRHMLAFSLQKSRRATRN
ncbi:MAG: hypothetical protein J6B24_09995 [Clostridia bacterium]|nr:hypothetical protein [Clostridia bacterium]